VDIDCRGNGKPDAVLLNEKDEKIAVLEKILADNKK